ncbi:hypothetical protein HJB53_06585 [Rhizobium lentis]|uniref:hypothetical protein n=1 Tax=Rhizobium lentis TaxID=1138194 RepID=UPI001C83654B|nr:hypothetical protein [Rhizobium lentis]MBX5126206.1 hypothetical protein [Rhizobium lentis]
MVDPKDKDPAEGSRETVDKELARQGEGKSHGSAGKSDGQKGPAQLGQALGKSEPFNRLFRGRMEPLEFLRPAVI